MKIRSYVPSDADRLVSMWRQSKQAALDVVDVYSIEDYRFFLTEILIKRAKLFVAEDEPYKTICGFMAVEGDWVSQLYIRIEDQGKGLGKRFLDLAKQSSTGQLCLYTFEKNQRARAFFKSQGFKEVGPGIENEENLPDIELLWERT